MASLSYIGASMISTATIVIYTLAASPHSCYNNLNPMIDSNVSQSQEILKNSIKSAMDRLSLATSLDFAVNGTLEKLIGNSMPNNGLALSALESCRELLSLAMDNLNNSFSLDDLRLVEIRDNIKTWLCAAGADLQTCLHGFDDLVYEVRNVVIEKLKSSIDDTSNIRAIMAQIDSCSSSNGDSSKTNMVGQDSSSRSRDHNPYWLSSEDRRILQASNINANVIVAKDGSGGYSKISDALKAVPNCSNNRFVIYVKKGVYYENVKVEMYQWNVMMIGDGMNETVVSGNLSYGGGLQTYDTATFFVIGQGFIARDMGFLNTAGAAMHQAVALMSRADQSVFYRCRIDGYQDTLYVHSNRQFYRECYIYGTVDFIFGDAAVVIQNSTILAKKPLHGQENTITAHHKTDQRCETGIVVQMSTIQPAEDLTGVNTYLGRPWSAYSTTVFMENYMYSLIDPRGWRPWNDSVGAPPPANTIFLAEYNNKGEGATITNRVKWKGVRVNLSDDEASKYTVNSLINGDQWLPATNLPSKDRRILQASKINANVVVAKDGSGNYRKITDALKAVACYSNNRFVIYEKKGIYHENVKVETCQWNVMMFGDGMNDTIVFNNLSYGGGRQTYDTATFNVQGQGFIARDMGFRNTAGPTMQQAVALVSSADRSVFYRCRIDGYQDTLYAQSNRQFYRECHIYGTIDFIFGDAAVVIQKSTISIKKPLHGQKNTITAHQKTNQNCQTGIVIQKSIIRSSQDLTGVSTFLGRPWSEYSTTVFLENYIHSLIDPKGWMPWDDSEGAPPPANTIFLAEYNNRGSGAITTDRVKWNGVIVNLSYAEANTYTVQSLIQGDQWLPATYVGYDLAL